MRRLLLLGSPNCGKTTLFNKLTGNKERVGNWPGVTVESKTKCIKIENLPYELTDLPGIYTLASDTENTSQDQSLTLDILQQANIENTTILNIIDSSQLERDLYLTLQLCALGFPMIVVLNKKDCAEKQKIVINKGELSKALGCPVIELEYLKQALLKQEIPHVFLEDLWDTAHALTVQVQQQQPLKNVVITETLDKLFLNRLLGLPIFFLMMYTLFFLAIHVGGSLQPMFERFSTLVFVEGFAATLRAISMPEILINALAYGVGRGVSVIMTFVPVIAILFFCLSLLESSGYMTRAAFVIDRVMRFLGLPGKSFVPMIIGFGCNVPGVMAARTLESRRDQFLTILMTPFMSCSARLTIYAVFVAAFFPHSGENIIFSLYLLGILMAVFTGFLLKSFASQETISPLLLELPAYQRPSVFQLLKETYSRLHGFILRSGRMIVIVCAILSILNAFSILSWLAQSITPLFSPMGITQNNWLAVVGLMTGMLAKEVVIGTLSSLDPHFMSHFDGPIGAYAYLLFILLYIPCVSTMAVIKQETSRRLMWFSIGWSLLLAYSVAVVFYQLATFDQHILQSSTWLVIILLMNALTIYSIKLNIRRHQGDWVSAALCGGQKSCVTACGGCQVTRGNFQ